MRMKSMLAASGLHTICTSGRCPNITECYSRGTATFLLMGDRCTRRCGFCDVLTGVPAPLDPEEPERVANAVVRLGLSYVVLTSVTRDDLPDGGAAHFADTVRTIKEKVPRARVEVLTPDFRGSADALATVLASSPDVFGHNIETCARLYPTVRPEGSYERALDVLLWLSRSAGGPRVKSGLMIGLGETDGEVWDTLVDLAKAGCRIVTIGQYLRPSLDHRPVARFMPPDEFSKIAARAGSLGFEKIVAGPLVRSSYLADQAFESISTGETDARE